MNTTTIVIAVIAGLFGAGGIAALWKVRKEANNISVTSAETAVGAVTDAMKTLTDELHRAQARIAVLEAAIDVNQQERKALLQRIESLEHMIQEVREGVQRINGNQERGTG